MITNRLTRSLSLICLLASVCGINARCPAQLDGSWTVTIGGQTVTPDANGYFRMRNISAADLFGSGGQGSAPDFMSDDPVRMLATRVLPDGTPQYAFSAPFFLSRGQIAVVSDIVITETPPSLARSLRIDTDQAVIQVGQTTQLTVWGLLADDTEVPLTRREDWTTYRTSNPAIATIEQDGDNDNDGIPDGTVTGVRVGTVFITASNDAATAVRRITVSETTRHTTVQGFVYDPLNQPVSGAIVSADVVGGSAVTGPNGRFSFPVTYTPDDSVLLRITATAVVQGITRVAVAFDLPPVNNGITDAGIMILRPLCNPEWGAGFDAAGFNASVFSMITVPANAGIEPGVYAAGAFTAVGGQGATPLNGVARWNGSAWLPLGSGLNGAVHALALYTTPAGSVLIAGGDFTMSGATPMNRVAIWDGSAWYPMSTGMNDTVTSLAVVGSPAGPQLYAGGWFTSAGGVPANRIARWNADSSTWEPLGSGLNRAVLAMASYDPGSGPRLIVGGDFTFAGGNPASRLAAWNGSAWTTFGSGADAPIRAMAAIADGVSPALYLAGDFTTINGVAASRIARYNGLAFTPLAQGLNSTVRALAPRTSPEGFTLYAVGDFTQAGAASVARAALWNGAAWSPLDSGLNSTARAVSILGSPAGPSVFVGGDFSQAGGGPVGRAAMFSPSTGWSGFGSGLNGPVNAFTTLPAGSASTSLVAAGSFSAAGNRFVSNIAVWDGSVWSDLAGGVNDIVFAAASRMEQGGTALYVGGLFDRAGPSPGLPANLIARYHNGTWSGLGGGVNGPVRALHFFDDGSGSALFVGGAFSAVGGATGIGANNIAKWSGAQWLPLGPGLNGRVLAMTTFDTDRSGPLPPSLIVVGEFTATASGTPVTVNRIARWNGMTWSSIGSANLPVRAIAVFGKGLGEELYIAGDFTQINGVNGFNRVARWDGSVWTPLTPAGIGDGSVNSLAVFSDGIAPSLYLAGSFTMVNGAPASRIAQWTGSTFATLQSGVNGSVQSIFGFDRDGAGGEFPTLFAGGSFSAAGTFGSGGIARWNRPLLCGNFLFAPPPSPDSPPVVHPVHRDRLKQPPLKEQDFADRAQNAWRITGLRAVEFRRPEERRDFAPLQGSLRNAIADNRAAMGEFADATLVVTGANAAGQLTGYAQKPDGTTRAFRFSPPMLDCPARLEDLGADSPLSSRGLGINAMGFVSGQFNEQASSSFAFVAAPGSSIIDLNSKVPIDSGWRLLSADRISDALLIEGDGILAGVPARFELQLAPAELDWSIPPCCAADVDQDHAVTSTDFHQYLAAFFEGQASADRTGDARISAEDFYLFIRQFLDGCP